MGQKIKMNKSELQKSKLKSVLISLLSTEIALFEFERTLLTDEKDIQACKNLIQKGKKAQEIIANVEHTDILSSLFNSWFAGKETYYLSLAVTINKDVRRFDKTKKGYQEFLIKEKEARAKYEEEREEQIRNKAIIEKARAEGKKVEMTLVNGKVVPIVVEEPKN